MGGGGGREKGRCGNVPVKNTLSPISFFLPPNPLPLSTPESKSKLKIMPIVSCFIRLTCLFLFMTVEASTQPCVKMVQSATQ